MRSKKAQMSLGVIVIVIMGIIACLAILPEIFTQQSAMTTKNTVADEAIDISTARNSSGDVDLSRSNFTVANAPSGWKVTECPLTSVVYGNATEDWVLATDYNVYADSGIIQVLNSSNTVTDQNGNSTFVDYTYCLDGYNTSGGSRSIAGLIGLFTALALVAFVIGYGVKEWL